MGLLKQLISRKELGFYIIVGFFATAVDWTTFTILVKGLQLNYQLALLLALMMGGLAHYLTNKKVTFECRSQAYYSQLSIYIGLAAFNFISSMGMMSCLIKYLGINQVLARILTTGMMLLPNYLLHKHLTFNKKLFS